MRDFSCIFETFAPICITVFNLSLYDKKKDMAESSISLQGHSSTKPSENTSDYWIFAENKTQKNSEYELGYTGKWLIFEPLDRIDKSWEIVKNATESGVLGFASKVATMKENPIAFGAVTKVICVYTRDHRDEEDVMRVRQQLRLLGFEKKLPYKTDEATHAGQYRGTGHKRVSKYYV